MTTSEQTNVIREEFCTVHPTVEANLHCNRCGRPMCTRCAVLTPVGYRCRECVRQQQDKFFDAQMIDYLIAGIVSFVASFFAAFIVSRIGFFLIAIFLSPAVGGMIGSLVWRMTRKRRGRYTAVVVGAGVVLGGLIFLPANPINIGLWIYLFLATGAAMAPFRLRL